MALSLVPRDKVFFDLFAEAGQNSLRSAQLLKEMLETWPDDGGLARDILKCESEGDRITHDIIQRLNSTFVTPLDREDIYGLAGRPRRHRRLRRGNRRLPRPLQDRGADGAVAGACRGPRQVLRAARRAARRTCAGSRTSRHYWIEIHRLENDGDRIYRDAVASLFSNGIDPMVVIRWKDIFGVLERAIDATETAAHIVEGIVIKNS